MSEYFITYGIEDDYENAVAEYGEGSDEAANALNVGQLRGSYEAACFDAIRCLIEWCQSTIEVELEDAAECTDRNDVRETVFKDNCERYLGKVQEVVESIASAQVTFCGPISGEIIHINQA